MMADAKISTTTSIQSYGNVPSEYRDILFVNKK